jgi:2-polyprenyl-3-methyl-5-hydroxy-6-metoxy-1,4-benzoquinol methylase
MGDAAAYDALSRVVLGSLIRHVAADVAADASGGARVLDVGSGPGHLATRLARRHGLHMTSLDLDPAMIDRAQSRNGLHGGVGRALLVLRAQGSDR